MELFLNCIFYKTSWLLFTKHIPLKLLKKLYFVVLLLNFLQSGIMLLYWLKHELQKDMHNYLILCLSQFCILLLMANRIDDIYKKDLNFLVEAQKYDKNIKLSPFEPIVRKKISESVLGIINIIYSLLKTLATFHSDFFYSIDNSFAADNCEGSTCEDMELPQFTILQLIAFSVFELYYAISVYLSIYQLLAVFLFMILKFGYVYISLQQFALGFYIQKYKKRKSKLDQIDCQTNNFLSKMHEILNSVAKEKSSVNYCNKPKPFGSENKTAVDSAMTTRYSDKSE